MVDALRATGRRVVELSTESYAELEAMAAKTVAEGIDALIVVGGDGTAQLGTNVCVNTDTPLGILPSGTGNDTAQGILGMPIGDVDAAIGHHIQDVIGVALAPTGRIPVGATVRVFTGAGMRSWRENS